jgi:copper chaperone
MTILSVPDMTCGHCKAAVESTLKTFPEVGSVSIDLSTRRVEISGTAPVEALLLALDQAGYPAAVSG